MRLFKHHTPRFKRESLKFLKKCEEVGKSLRLNDRSADGRSGRDPFKTVVPTFALRSRFLKCKPGTVNKETDMFGNAPERCRLPLPHRDLKRGKGFEGQ